MLQDITCNHSDGEFIYVFIGFSGLMVKIKSQ